MHSSGTLISSLLALTKTSEEDCPKITDGILIISKQLKSVLQTANDMNCCWVEKSSESRHRTVLNKTKSFAGFF